MKSSLRIKTKGKEEENEGGDEAVSPSGQYLSTKALCFIILGVVESEVPIDESILIHQIQHVFLSINPKFSSIMVTDKKGEKQWKRVEVNVEDHVKIVSKAKGLAIESSNDEEFDEYLTEMSTKALGEEKPLWEIHICKYPTSKAAGHIVFKLHHALGDGYSLMGALLSCVKRVDNPSLPVTFPSTRSSTTTTSTSDDQLHTNITRALYAVFNGVFDFGKIILKMTNCMEDDDKTPIRSGYQGMSNLYPCKVSTISFSLHQIKLIKTKLRTTINELVAGVVLLGIRLYMQENDKKSCTSKSTAIVLFNTRNVKGYKSVEEMTNRTADTKLWGNQFAFLYVAIPKLKLVDEKNSNPIDFINKTKKRITRVKNSPAIYLTAQFLEIVRKFKGPKVVAELIYKTMNKSSVEMTNMIGPFEQVAMAEHPVKGLYFIVSGSPKSVQITMMSYMGTLRIGVVVEKGFIDSQKLSSCIENAFQLTVEASTNTI